MNRLRNKITARLVAGFLIASLFPFLLSVPESFAGHTHEQSHAEWLKSLLRTQPSETISTAIAEAESHDHATQRDFLISFVRSFEAQQSGESLPSYFTHIAVSNDELILLLQGKLAGIGADVYAVQSSLRAVPAGNLGTTRPLFEASPRDVQKVAERHPANRTAGAELLPRPAIEGWLTALQPLGP